MTALISATSLSSGSGPWVALFGHVPEVATPDCGRDGGTCLLYSRRCCGATRQHHVRRERGQFRRVSANVGGTGRGPASVDAHVAADGPPRLLQPLQERPDAGLKFRIVGGCGQEHADASHTLGLLRARRERPCSRRAAEERDELASFAGCTTSGMSKDATFTFEFRHYGDDVESIDS